MRGRVRIITGVALIVAILLVGAAALAWSRRVRESAGPQVGTGIGDVAPAFTVTTLGGSTLTSAALRGHPIVLTSAAAWCPTCALEAEQLSAAFRAAGGSLVALKAVQNRNHLIWGRAPKALRKSVLAGVTITCGLPSSSRKVDTR